MIRAVPENKKSAAADQILERDLTDPINSIRDRLVALATERALVRTIVGIWYWPGTGLDTIFAQQADVEVPSAGTRCRSRVSPMARQAHDLTAANRSRPAICGARKILEGNIREIRQRPPPVVRVVLAIIPVVAIHNLRLERLVNRMLELRKALIVVAAMTIPAPPTHALEIGGVVVQALTITLDSDPDSPGGRCNKGRNATLDFSHSIEHSEAGATMRIVAARATKILGSKRPTWSDDKSGIWIQPESRGSQIVARCKAGYRSNSPIDRIVEVVLQQKREVARTLFWRGKQRVQGQNRPVVGGVTRQAEVAGTLSHELKTVLSTWRQWRAVDTVMNHMTSTTTGHATLMESS